MPKRTSGHDRRLRRGDGWIEERTNAAGETRFLARWREPDSKTGERVVRSQTFHLESDAEAHLRDVADKQARGGYLPPDRMTVAELVASYLERGAHRWKPATLAAYRQRAESHIAAPLGKLPVSDLTAPRVQHWIDAMVRDKLAATTIDGAIRVLLGACRDAVMLGILPANPVSGTRRPSIKPAPVAVWTAEEAARVVAAVADDPMWHAAYRVALGTGMRPGELRVLRWADVDLDRGAVVVRRTMTKDEAGRQVIGETTKTGKARAIALAAATVAALREWRTVQLRQRLAAPVWHDGDLMFATGRGRPISQRHWQEKHEAVVAAAGVKRVRLHDMRHTAATLMLSRRVPAKIVSDILGHASVAFTQDRYQHVDEEMQRGAVDDLDAVLSATTSRR